MAARLRSRAIVRTAAPALTAKTGYGMPALARDGSAVCFFEGAHKFKARDAKLDFSDKASLDEDALWPFAFALKALSAGYEIRIAALLKEATS